MNYVVNTDADEHNHTGRLCQSEVPLKNVNEAKHVKYDAHLTKNGQEAYNYVASH